MAEKKVHKIEKPNKAEPTPQAKKAIDLRGSGLSLREISETLNIPRTKVEELVKGIDAPARLPANDIEKGETAIADNEAKAKSKEANAKARPAQRAANAKAADKRK